MKQSLKSGIPEFDEAVEQFENGEINFVELTSRLWNKAYKIGQTEQCNIADVSISLERAKKYARHQHFLGTQGKELVEFEDWKQD